MVKLKNAFAFFLTLCYLSPAASGLTQESKMTSAIGNFSNAYSYSGAVGGAAGKLYVPVSRSALLYSHFDHVSGVAAGNGQQGVSISKIRILNSLIDRISAIQNKPKESVSDISDDQAQALIEQYQKQIQQTVAQQSFLLAGTKPMAGTLFQIDA